MAFFRKLKDRLFKSSSKLDEGLEALVEDGGSTAPADEITLRAADAATVEPPAPAPVAEITPDARPEPVAPQETVPEPAPEPAPVPEPAPERPGLIGRLMGREPAQPKMTRVLDDDMLESLEEVLIAADLGVETALKVTANMAEGRLGRRLGVDEIKTMLAEEVTRVLEPVARPMPLFAKTPQVVLVVGVNGSGKTTTIGKLASQFKAAGKSVVIAAGDTFRAAAVEQLQVWGDRAGVPVMKAEQGTDPASLAF